MANISVVLDPGHSRQRPGAHFNGLKEEELNLIQADFIKQVLDSVGVFNVKIIDRADDNKTQIAYASKGSNLFVSLHHNSFQGSGDPYSSVHTHSMGNSTETKLLSSSIAKEFKRHFGTVKEVRQELAVLKAAQAVQVPACVLVESYFLQGGYDEDEAIARTKLAGYAIASGIIVYSQRVHTDRYTATQAGTVAHHLEECRTNADRDSEGQKTSQVQKSTSFSPEGKITNVTETTTTEEEEETDASVSVSTYSKEEDRRVDTTTSIVRDNGGPKYSLGVSIQRSIREDFTKPLTKGEIEIEIGRKIIGDLWLTGAYRLDNTIRLGFRLEF